MSESLFPLETRHFNIKPKNEEKPLSEEWIVAFNNGDRAEVGSISFEDAVFHGEIKISVELKPQYDKARYVEEIFVEMARFAFQSDNVREISTVVRHENEHRVRGLEKAGYVYRQFKDGNDYYSIKKQKTSWQGLYFFIGLVAGFLIGIIISNLWIGTIGGVIIGSVIGYLMDKNVQKDKV